MMAWRLRTLLITLILFSLLGGVSLTKVVCVHLDTKTAHVETLELLDDGNEIHLSIDNFLSSETGKVKVLLKADSQSRESFKYTFFKEVRLKTKEVFSHHPTKLLRTVRLTT